MTSVYVTKAGDALDLICMREYGEQAGAVERVLEVNPHIKTFAHRLPAGQSIALPDIVASGRAGKQHRLWD